MREALDTMVDLSSVYVYPRVTSAQHYAMVVIGALVFTDAALTDSRTLRFFRFCNGTGPPPGGVTAAPTAGTTTEGVTNATLSTETEGNVTIVASTENSTETQVNETLSGATEETNVTTVDAQSTTEPMTTGKYP